MFKYLNVYTWMITPCMGSVKRENIL